MTITHGPTPAPSGEVFRADPSIVFGDLLSTGEDDLITREMVIRAIDPERRTADFVASTGEVDSHGEIVSQNDWQLGDFLRNPVCLFAHQSRELPIGQCVDVAVRNGQLECRILFANKEQNPKAENVWLLVKDKFLRAVSVGFIPQEARYEMRDGNDVLVWSKCLLKEISVTPIGANASALAKMKALAKKREGNDGGAAPAVLGIPEAAPPPAAPAINSEGAPPRKDDVMSDTVNKDLQDKVEAQAKIIALSDAEVKTLTARAEKAEKATADLDAKVKSLETDKAALEAQAKTLTADRDAEKAGREKAEAIIIEQEVESLVGKKITPAEKPGYVELRKSNPTLFKTLMEQRQDLKLTEQVVPAEKSNGASGNASIDLFNEVKKTAGL